MTGVGAPYEAPEHPDLVVRSGEETVEEAVERVMRLLEVRSLYPAARNGHDAARPALLRSTLKHSGPPQAAGVSATSGPKRGEWPYSSNALKPAKVLCSEPWKSEEPVVSRSSSAAISHSSPTCAAV